MKPEDTGDVADFICIDNGKGKVADKWDIKVMQMSASGTFTPSLPKIVGSTEAAIIHRTGSISQLNNYKGLADKNQDGAQREVKPHKSAILKWIRTLLFCFFYAIPVAVALGFSRFLFDGSNPICLDGPHSLGGATELFFYRKTRRIRREVTLSCMSGEALFMAKIHLNRVEPLPSFNVRRDETHFTCRCTTNDIANSYLALTTCQCTKMGDAAAPETEPVQVAVKPPSQLMVFATRAEHKARKVYRAVRQFLSKTWLRCKRGVIRAYYSIQPRTRLLLDGGTAKYQAIRGSAFLQRLRALWPW